jgi:hypothetical protein
LPGSTISVTLNGTGLYSGGTTKVQFGSGNFASSVSSCTSGTQCTASYNIPSTATGEVFVEAGTPTGTGGAYVFSPGLISADQFSFAPVITSASFASSVLTVALSNLSSIASLSSFGFSQVTSSNTIVTATQSVFACTAGAGNTASCTMSIPGAISTAAGSTVAITATAAVGGTSAQYSLAF